jgi:hypothetical protein
MIAGLVDVDTMQLAYSIGNSGQTEGSNDIDAGVVEKFITDATTLIHSGSWLNRNNQEMVYEFVQLLGSSEITIPSDGVASPHIAHLRHYVQWYIDNAAEDATPETRLEIEPTVQMVKELQRACEFLCKDSAMKAGLWNAKEALLGKTSMSESKNGLTRTVQYMDLEKYARSLVLPHRHINF